MQQDRSTSDQRQHNLALSLQTQSQRRTDTQAMGSTHCMGLKPLPRGQEEKEGAQCHGSAETKMQCFRRHLFQRKLGGERLLNLPVDITEAPFFLFCRWDGLSDPLKDDHVCF